MVRPIQENLVPVLERRPSPINERASLAARRITALALSAIAAVVTFIASESLFIATLTGLTFYALVSLVSDDSTVTHSPRPMREYRWFNPIRYVPTWNWYRAPVVHPQREHRDHARPAEVVHGVPVLNPGPRVQVQGDHRNPATPHRMGPRATYTQESPQGNRYSPSRPEALRENAQPAEVVQGIPVRNAGTRVQVQGSHRNPLPQPLMGLGATYMQEPPRHEAPRENGQPAEIVQGIPVRNAGSRVEVEGGHRNLPRSRMGLGATYAAVVQGASAHNAGPRVEVEGAPRQESTRTLASFGPYPQAHRSPQNKEPSAPPLPITPQASVERQNDRNSRKPLGFNNQTPSQPASATRVSQSPAAHPPGGSPSGVAHVSVGRRARN